MKTRTPLLILVCGALILALSMGIRQSLGLFLGPMSSGLGWPITIFSTALAVQNLMWGLAQPLAGALADRYGTARTLLAGAALYAGGLVIMAFPGTPLVFNLGAGLVVGLGVAATGFPVVLAAVARAYPPEKRSAALGLASAGGSFGQFVMAPLSQGLLSEVGWVGALLAVAMLAGLMAPLGAALAGRGHAAGMAGSLPGPGTLRAAIREASGHGGYLLLNIGFFVCGFHVAFIATHLPMYLDSCGMPAGLGATALALIGFFNMAGSYLAGLSGGRWRKKYLLSGIYLGRAIAIAVFLALPTSQMSVLAFSAAMGFLWLGTVPLTSGLVAQIFGPRYMATLFGIVLLSHQIGAFLGAWMGGYLFELTGSYDGTWMAAIGLGLFAAVVHLPIADRSLRAPA